VAVFQRETQLDFIVSHIPTEQKTSRCGWQKIIRLIVPGQSNGPEQTVLCLSSIVKGAPDPGARTLIASQSLSDVTLCTHITSSVCIAGRGSIAMIRPPCTHAFSLIACKSLSFSVSIARSKSGIFDLVASRMGAGNTALT
jgi:hypothetical protein